MESNAVKLDKVMEVLISKDGTLRLIFADELAPALPELGRVQITRASHVEPDADGNWIADMSPVRGGKLGPFRLRRDALDAEVRYLLDHGIPVPLVDGLLDTDGNDYDRGVERQQVKETE